MVQKNHVDVNCVISDLRFVFAVPTANKLLKISMKLQDIFESLEKDRLTERKTKLEMYEYVLARMSNSFQTDQENLVKRIFFNLAKSNKMDV